MGFIHGLETLFAVPSYSFSMTVWRSQCAFCSDKTANKLNGHEKEKEKKTEKLGGTFWQSFLPPHRMVMVFDFETGTGGRAGTLQEKDRTVGCWDRFGLVGGGGWT